MKVNNDVFVKLNYKSIGEFKSLIIDKNLGSNEEDKYMMCAGNYNKNGWTFVFKANSLKEAEELINNNKFATKKIYKAENADAYNEVISEKKYNNKKLSNSNLRILEPEIVQIPTWM